jgi:hypothetical protein
MCIYTVQGEGKEADVMGDMLVRAFNEVSREDLSGTDVC